MGASLNVYGYVFRNVILREKKSKTKLTANVLKQDQATLTVKRERQSDAVVFCVCLPNDIYSPCLPTMVFPASTYRRIPVSIYRGVFCVYLP